MFKIFISFLYVTFTGETLTFVNTDKVPMTDQGNDSLSITGWTHGFAGVTYRAWLTAALLQDHPGLGEDSQNCSPAGSLQFPALLAATGSQLPWLGFLLL